MSLYEWTNAIVGAVVIGGLGVSLAYGAHTVVEGSGPEIVMSDDFCTLMDDFVALTATLDSESAFDVGALADQSRWDDPALLEALHAAGQSELERSEIIVAYYSHAADLATDTEAASAFRDLAEIANSLNPRLGAIARDADSMASYVSEIQGLANDEWFVASVTGFMAPARVASRYSVETCGIDIFDRAFTTSASNS